MLGASARDRGAPPAVWAAVSAAVLLGVTGCGEARPDGGSADVLEGDWVLSYGEVDGEELQIPADAQVTLAADGAQISGTSACNRYEAELRNRIGGIIIGQFGGTEMACEPELMQAEAEYLGALERMVEARRTDDGTLLLTGEASELHFEPAGS